MVFFNWATMQMAAKIVYYGPGLCGKTSNLSYIYAKTAPGSRGEMVSLETESDRTLFFDLLPIEVGSIGGFKTRLQLYTVPGQVFYNTTRKLVLKGVDGLVFVADSQRPMRDANLESFNSLKENLKELGLEPADLPTVLQFNKRDLKNILSIEELNNDLNPHGTMPFFEASAITGEGVITTLKEITKLTLKKLRSRMSTPEGAAQPRPASAPTPVRAVKPPQPAGPISAQSLARAAEEGVGDESKPAAARTVQQTQSQPAREMSDAQAGTHDRPAAPPAAPPPPKPERREPFETTEDAAADAQASDAGEVFGGDGKPPAESEGTPAQSDEDAPPLKRVQVTNQMDILAELDNLRKQATMQGRGRDFASPASDLDLDSLLSSTSPKVRELREKLETAVNSDIFKNMRSFQVAIRITGESGDTIHAFDPVSLEVKDAEGLKKICLRFSLDLENLR